MCFHINQCNIFITFIASLRSWTTIIPTSAGLPDFFPSTGYHPNITSPEQVLCPVLQPPAAAPIREEFPWEVWYQWPVGKLHLPYRKKRYSKRKCCMARNVGNIDENISRQLNENVVFALTLLLYYLQGVPVIHYGLMNRQQKFYDVISFPTGIEAFELVWPVCFWWH